MATCDWTEEDVALAREYRDLLLQIKELQGTSEWTQADVELARDYAQSLREIAEPTK